MNNNSVHHFLGKHLITQYKILLLSLPLAVGEAHREMEASSAWALEGQR